MAEAQIQAPLFQINSEVTVNRPQILNFMNRIFFEGLTRWFATDRQEPPTFLTSWRGEDHISFFFQIVRTFIAPSKSSRYFRKSVGCIWSKRYLNSTLSQHRTIS